MSVAPHSGVIDFGTFTPPDAPLDGIQGEVPAPLLTEVGYFLSTNGWQPVSSGGGTVTSITAGTGLSGGTITSSGTIAIDSTVVTLTGSQTLTNKTITLRVVNVTSSSSITIDSSTTDQYNVTALAVGTTFNAPTGSPTAGQKLIIRIKDNGTAQTLAWNAIFRVIGVTLPTTTVANKTFYIACIYNLTDTSWDVVSVAQQV